MDERQIRSLTRRHIIFALELLKEEVWEQCETDDDVVTAKHELEEIIDLLHERDRGDSRAPASKEALAAAPFDPVSLRDEFRLSNLAVSQRARWSTDDPGAPPRTCRYCGKHWKRWAGSKLDGHAACMVTEDFKTHLSEILCSPTVSYRGIADAIGVSPSVIRAWADPTRATSEK
jgi:hypothetical protein